MIKIILAQSVNGIIGDGNKLPWDLPDELKEFKEKTTGHTVLMGRKTWDSLPEKFRPLPKRTNIIASKDLIFADDITKKYGSVYNRVDSHNKDVRQSIPFVAYSIDGLCNHTKDKDDGYTLWVIGGKSIYEKALPHTDELHITTVMKEVEGDILAPEIDYTKFNMITQTRVKFDSKSNIPYYTTIYRRKI